jgi:HEAT repeat protein
MMDNDLAVKLDPAKTPDAIRQSTVEKLYSSKAPDPEIWRLIPPAVQKEPVQWIRRLEIRLLKKVPFSVEMAAAITSLLTSSDFDVRTETATLLRNIIVTLITEKKVEERKAFEEKLFDTLVINLKDKENQHHHALWIELYKTLGAFSQKDEVAQALIDLLQVGGDEAFYVFAQYANGKYPAHGLEPLLTGFKVSKEDEAQIHIIRALIMVHPKEGIPIGYPSTEPVIQTLLDAIKSKSENVRKEAAIALASRAKVARKLKSPLPLEEEVWEALFNLYQWRLPSTSAVDKDQAREALRYLPTGPERLSRLFELMHRVQDELQKQNVVGLIGTFKTPETRAELIKMLKVNFAGLRLEAQKTTVDAISAFVPDPEVEAELEHLLEGKGLHADIQAKLADRLFSDIPSLKDRLKRWLRIDEKSKRPILERFDLPIMHIKVIESGKKIPGDNDVRRLLKGLDPFLMMNDARVKLHETLREFPDPEGYSTQVLPMDQVAKVLVPQLDPLFKARIVFDGFALPGEFGGSKELEYGNVKQTNAQGLGIGAAEMGKDFVKKMVEDLFAGDMGEFVPAGTQFRLTNEGDGLFTLKALTPASASAKH